MQSAYHPLSRFAPSPSLAAREGDDTLGAGRPFLGVTGLGRTGFRRGGHASDWCQTVPMRRVHQAARSEEHTSELQSPCNLVCRLLLEKKKQTRRQQAVQLDIDLDLHYVRCAHLLMMHASII